VKYLIKNATIIDAAAAQNGKKYDVLIQDGIITAINKQIKPDKNTQVISESNLLISAGWVDLFCHFADPGFEQKETLETGTNAAMAGGFTEVAILPNTLPTISNKSQVEYIVNKCAGGLVQVYPLGSISKQCQGKELAEMMDMHASGAIAFTDGITPLHNKGLLIKALQYVKAINTPLIQLPIDVSIGGHPQMHEGTVSTQLGLMGSPELAEELCVSRDIEIAAYTQSHMHITGISTAGSVQLIKAAKKRGVPVTCSVNIHHLLFTDSSLYNYDSTYKIWPPLRTAKHSKALLAGIASGVIDAISTHHLPQHWDAKHCELEYAEPGMIGLETALHTILSIPNNTIPIEQWVHLLTAGPRSILGLTQQGLQVDAIANITVFSTNQGLTYTQKQSLGVNSPYLGQQLNGKVVAVFNNHQAYINE
jgi:dihydroorotase